MLSPTTRMYIADALQTSAWRISQLGAPVMAAENGDLRRCIIHLSFLKFASSNGVRSLLQIVWKVLRTSTLDVIDYRKISFDIFPRLRGIRSPTTFVSMRTVSYRRGATVSSYRFVLNGEIKIEIMAYQDKHRGSPHANPDTYALRRTETR